MPKVYVNGSLVDEDAATISVFDHGLVVGDGVFETILRPSRTSRSHSGVISTGSPDQLADSASTARRATCSSEQ